MARVSRTPFVILGILGVADRPVSGYDIKRIIDQTISHFWSESYGQIYPVLKRMTADKLIEGRTARKTDRRKVLYTLTSKGKRSLRAWMEEPPIPSHPRDELILKLFFGSQTDPSVSIRHLAAHRDKLVAALEQYGGWLKILESQKDPNTPYQAITLRGGIAVCKTIVQWANESLETLNQLKRTSQPPN